MKILIISDIHANFDALSSLQETYDEMWVLGDLVNYGPEPAAVVDFVRAKASVIVCGNHDYAVGFSPEARYAIWENGNIELKSYFYPIEPAVTKVQALPIKESCETS